MLPNKSITPDLLSISTMTLATTGSTGDAHAAPVYFVADKQLKLYFFSDRESQHGQDIAHNHSAAVAFYPECQGWEDIRGVQMHGEVRLVEPGPELEIAWKIYSVKFPFVIALEEIVAQNALYVFVPNWIRLVDSRQGFGFKQEWTLP